MPVPTREQLSDPAFTKAVMDGILDTSFRFETPITDILKRVRRPKFRRMREVHAARARKLRRRGEHVHFLRWEHGHCIYGWGGPMPDSITFRMMRGRPNC